MGEMVKAHHKAIWARERGVAGLDWYAKGSPIPFAYCLSTGNKLETGT